MFHNGTTFSKLITWLVLLIVSIGVFASCVTADTTSSSPGQSTRCETPPPAKIAAISEGLEPGLSFGAVAAVRSRDFERVWFIAARIDGPGLGRDIDVGVWASNRLDNDGVIFAVDGVAATFSDWSRMGNVSLSDDGIREARACV